MKLFLSAVLAMTFSNAALACDCISTNITKEFQSADQVFLGYAIRNGSRQREYTYYSVPSQMTIHQMYKGIVFKGDKTEGVIEVSQASNNCALEIEEDKNYLVFATLSDIDEDGVEELTTSTCALSTKLNQESYQVLKELTQIGSR